VTSAEIAMGETIRSQPRGVERSQARGLKDIRTLPSSDAISLQSFPMGLPATRRSGLSIMAAVVVVVMLVSGIVDVVHDMPRVIAATVVIGIIMVDIARADREANPRAAGMTLAFDHIMFGLLAGL
jgi:hypothetical protein